MASTNGNTAAAAPSNGSVDPRLVRLREAMGKADGGKGVSAYIIPTEDPHMSEYPPDTLKRREYISRWVGAAAGWLVGLVCERV
jgi:Xaa-Pro aminopeptidase